MNDEQKAAYDKRVAEQLKHLKSANLEVHIPAKGIPYFAVRTPRYSRLTGKRK